jgi:Type IV secretion system pilin
MKKKLLIIISTVLLLIALAGVAQAYQIPDEYRPGNLFFGEDELDYNNDLEGQTQGSTATVIILQTIAGSLLYFATPLAVILIGFGAFNMVMGGADSEQLEQSKKHLTWTVIGLFLIILSYTLVRIIITFVSRSANVV